MAFGPEAWLIVFAAGAIGIGGMLLSLASAVRRGSALIDLEVRVRQLQAEQRQRMIERGLIEPDEGEVIEVGEVDKIIEVEPIAEPDPARDAVARSQAA
jgi:hypothetical protein